MKKLESFINKIRDSLLLPYDSVVPLFTVVALAFIAVMAVVLFSGCSHAIDGYACKCNCGEKQSIFECNGKEKIIETKANP